MVGVVSIMFRSDPRQVHVGDREPWRRSVTEKNIVADLFLESVHSQPHLFAFSLVISVIHSAVSLEHLSTGSREPSGCWGAGDHCVERQ